jgi:hypothetical protein
MLTLIKIAAVIGLSMCCMACSKANDGPQQDKSASMTLPGKASPGVCHVCGQTFFGAVCPQLECR